MRDPPHSPVQNTAAMTRLKLTRAIWQTMCRDVKVGCEIRYDDSYAAAAAAASVGEGGEGRAHVRAASSGESQYDVIADDEFEILEAALREAERQSSGPGTWGHKTTLPALLCSSNTLCAHSACDSKAGMPGSSSGAADFAPSPPLTASVEGAAEVSPDVVIEKVTRCVALSSCPPSHELASDLLV